MDRAFSGIDAHLPHQPGAVSVRPLAITRPCLIGWGSVQGRTGLSVQRTDMPGEISRPYRPPDTPEWREVQNAVDEWIDALMKEKEQERKKDETEEEIPW